MNKRPWSPAQLEPALAAKLGELLGQVEWLREAQVENVSAPASGFDLLARLPLPGGGGRGQVALCVECKSELRPI